MQENHLQANSPEAGLATSVRHLERNLEQLEAAMTEMRTAVRILAAQVRDAAAQPNGHLKLVTPEPVPHQEPPVPAVVESDKQSVEAAKDEVRKAVESTRAELSWATMKVDAGFSFGSSEPEPPVVEEPTAFVEPEPEFDSSSPPALIPYYSGATDDRLTSAAAAFVDDETRREAVRRAVGEARLALESGAPEVEEPVMPSEEASSEAPSFESAAFVDDEARREAVRRAVEDAGLHTESSATDVEEPEAAIENVLEPVVEVEAEEMSAETASIEARAYEDDEARREAVRRAVEEARSTPEYGAVSFRAPPTVQPQSEQGAEEDDEARREAVRRAVAEARSGSEKEFVEEDSAEPVVSDDARRDAVRRAVEAARAGMHNAGHHDAEVPAGDDEARREAVRRTVEQSRSLDWSSMKMDSSSWAPLAPEPGGFTIHPEQAPAADLTKRADQSASDLDAAKDTPSEEGDDDARREAVRAAVEAAKAELGVVEEGFLPEKPTIVPLVPRADAPMPKGADFNGPPVIVIEDASGRVELSQVFATLSKVDRSSQAALLNYSPHSVTIGLNMLAPLPAAADLVRAAESVFGRQCHVRAEGTRTAIEITNDPVGR